MDKKLLVATKNPGKIKEISAFLTDLPLKIVSLRDIGIEQDVEEDGKDYFENSQKKALFYAKLSGIPAVSDDGGLEIVSLDNAPGIHSRRWLGYTATDEELIEYMKKVAKELPEDNRDAYFKTVVTFATPSGEVFQSFGEVKGIIAQEPLPALLKGYPYRSFFYLPQLKKFYHETEMTEDELKIYNHRYKAMEELKKSIRRYFNL
jgi:XTP/dITP diphosphohydrolase